jgi:hypothetical protein
MIWQSGGAFIPVPSRGQTEDYLFGGIYSRTFHARCHPKAYPGQNRCDLNLYPAVHSIHIQVCFSATPRSTLYYPHSSLSTLVTTPNFTGTTRVNKPVLG